ncbi:MAG: cysteine desulfurase NifS [Candidatus Omnitrophica bacterium]|nr:cysteine desulfurase NifS [Candidatus Omnitrophota bacterium]MCM8794016.1 cysteine desulfurase NifS [Candidatus Omnitrophota bacterium]
MVERIVYLDHNATTPLAPEVLEAMLPYLKDKYGNPSSIYKKGREAREAVEKARRIIALSLGIASEDLVFTSGGTESNNFAIKGVALANKCKGNHIITSKIEHLSVLNICQFLERLGFEVTYLDVDKYGMMDPESVKKAIKKETILVTLMHANNEVGTIEPIEEISRITREREIYFHIDAVQSFGKIPFKIEDLGVDLLSLSAHKIYGPKGIGALYIRKGVNLFPLQHGGHQERKLRAGTENVAGIVGFGKAVELVFDNFEKKRERIRYLRDKLEGGLMARIENIYPIGHPTLRLPNTLNLGFAYLEGETILINLDLKGICASVGSACTSGSLEPSHVLKAMGIPSEVIQGAVRFSLGETNTEEEIDYCLEVIPAIVKRLRRMSPFKNH